MSEAFAGFDALVAAPAEEQTPTAPSPPTGDKPGSQAQPEAKPAAETKPTTETKPAGETTQPAKIKAATLREELDRTRADATDWRTKYEKLSAETAKPKPDPEKEQLLKDREAWNKTRAELENELKFASFERSQEYKDKYQQPFLKAYESGQKVMATLSVKEPDVTDEYGVITEAGKVRKASEADWEKLMAIQDEDAANKFIADHFGHNAARVTVLRDKVLDLHNQMRTAVEDFRKQAGERETQFRELMTKQQKEMSECWHTANARAAEKYPEYFVPDAADPKGNALLEQGARLTDLAFGVLDPADFPKLPQSIQDKLVNGRLPPAELTLLHSAIRNRSAAYDRLVSRLKQKEAEIKAKDEKLAGYEKSEPGRGQPRKTDQPGKKTTPSTWAEVDEAFDRLAAGNG